MFKQIRFPVAIITGARPWREIGGMGTRGVMRTFGIPCLPVGRYLIVWQGFRV